MNDSRNNIHYPRACVRKRENENENILINGLLVISLFAVPVFPAFAEDAADPSLKEEILKLQKMVLDLQKRIQQLEAERAKTDTKTPGIPGHAKQESRKKVQVARRTPATPEPK